MTEKKNIHKTNAKTLKSSYQPEYLFTDIVYVLENLTKCSSCSIQLLKFKTGYSEPSVYTALDINLTPAGALEDFIKSVEVEYSKIDKKTGNKRAEDLFTILEPFNGTGAKGSIYDLSVVNESIEMDIRQDVGKIIDAVNAPLKSGDPFEFNPIAYVLVGSILIPGKKTEDTIMLFSIQKPFTALKHKFLLTENSFKSIGGKVLNLDLSFDVLFINTFPYILSSNGERLFNLERSYKRNCKVRIDEIDRAGLVTDIDVLRKTANSGQNPRRFINFNARYLSILIEDRKKREILAKHFGIPMKDDKFDTEKTENADKLTKLLCGNAADDPLFHNPLEVPSSSEWK